LTGVTVASAGFKLGSIIRVKTPFLVHPEIGSRRPAAPPIQARSACAKHWLVTRKLGARKAAPPALR
jgi:hypothetical protein